MTTNELFDSVMASIRQGSNGEVATSAPDIALVQDILALFLADAHRIGVVGEDKLIATEFLAIESQHLDKPVSIVVKGASSSGKSHSTEVTCRFFPDDAIVRFTGMSEKALLLSERSYEHRTLVIYEAAALRERAERQSGDQTAYYLRSLLSEDRAEYEMSIKTKDGGWTTKRFEKRGPTNAIITTTSLALHNENETRMLSLPTNDSPSQTRSVLLQLAEEDALSVDLSRWHRLHDWIRRQDNRVVIPFVKALAGLVPDRPVRMRRDFKAVLSLIRAHAVLHQATRERDEQGRIVATLLDYGAVRDLVLDVLSEGLGTAVSALTRAVVAAIPEGGELSSTGVARALDIDQSAAYRRLQAALKGGYVVNKEERERRQGRYVRAEPLPDDVMALPEPDLLAAGQTTYAGMHAEPRVSHGAVANCVQDEPMTDEVDILPATTTTPPVDATGPQDEPAGESVWSASGGTVASAPDGGTPDDPIVADEVDEVHTPSEPRAYVHTPADDPPSALAQNAEPVPVATYVSDWNGAMDRFDERGAS